jgi:hypothetical protein
MSNLVLSHMLKWFAANTLVLDLDTTNIMKFITNNSSHSTLHIGYKEKYIEETVNTKFLGLQIDNYLNWKNHIEQTILKLSAAYYAVRMMVRVSSIYILKSIYYAYFYSTKKNGILFGVTLPIEGTKSLELCLVHNPELHLAVQANN